MAVVAALVSVLILASGCAKEQNVPKVDAAFLERMEAAEAERAYALVQFDHYVKDDEKSILEEKGMRLLEREQNNSAIVSFPADQFRELTVMEAVVRIADVPIEKKVSSALREGKVPTYVKNEDGTYNVIVRFYEEVSEGPARRVVGKYGVVTNIFSHSDLKKDKGAEPEEYPAYQQELGAKIKAEKVSEVAMENTVRRVRGILPPISTGTGPAVIVEDGNE